MVIIIKRQNIYFLFLFIMLNVTEVNRIVLIDHRVRSCPTNNMFLLGNDRQYSSISTDTENVTNANGFVKLSYFINTVNISKQDNTNRSKRPIMSEWQGSNKPECYICTVIQIITNVNDAVYKLYVGYRCWYLTSLSTICQLYRGGHFNWRR